MSDQAHHRPCAAGVALSALPFRADPNGNGAESL